MSTVVVLSLLNLDEQQAYAYPDQLTQTDDERHEDSGRRRETQSRGRHEESALAASELQRNEEKKIGKERGESKDQDAVEIVGRRHEDKKHKIDLQGGGYPASELEQD